MCLYRASHHSNLISHPIFLEYMKSYDGVANLRNVILKSLPPSAVAAASSSLGKYHDKLMSIRLVELDKEEKIMPQVIEMTASVESLLTELAVVFCQIVDELVAAKYDTLENEQKLIHLQNQQRAMVQSNLLTHLY